MLCHVGYHSRLVHWNYEIEQFVTLIDLQVQKNLELYLEK